LVTLTSIAITAQHLQIIRFITAAFGYRMDVVYLKRGTILGSYAAHLTAVVIALKDLKTQARLDGLAFWFFFWQI